MSIHMIKIEPNSFVTYSRSLCEERELTPSRGRCGAWILKTKDGKMAAMIISVGCADGTVWTSSQIRSIEFCNQHNNDFQIVAVDRKIHHSQGLSCRNPTKEENEQTFPD